MRECIYTVTKGPNVDTLVQRGNENKTGKKLGTNSIKFIGLTKNVAKMCIEHVHRKYSYKYHMLIEKQINKVTYLRNMQQLV